MRTRSWYAFLDKIAASGPDLVEKSLDRSLL